MQKMPARPGTTAATDGIYAGALELFNTAESRPALLHAFLHHLLRHDGWAGIAFYGLGNGDPQPVEESAVGVALAPTPETLHAALANPAAPHQSMAGAPPLQFFAVTAGTTPLGLLAVAADKIDASEQALLTRLAEQLAHCLQRLDREENLAAALARAAGRASAWPREDAGQRRRLMHELRAPLNVVIGFAEVLHDGIAGPLTAHQHDYVGNILGSGRELLARLDTLFAGEPAPVAAAPAQVAAVHHRPGAGPHRALVVEDDPAAARLISEMLESAGLVVRHAASAEAAWQALAEETPDLVTLDILLPVCDGWDLLARMKQVPTLAGVPVIVASILADQQRGLSLGAARTLQKPIARADFLHSLADLHLAPPAADGALPRVLLIDDDPRAVEILASYLDAAHYAVLRAHGGAEGIARAREEHPDAIVLDLLMPEVSGFAVLDALRADAATATIPVLVVTAKQLDAGERARLEDQARAVIEKSHFDRHRFVDEVRRLLSRSP